MNDTSELLSQLRDIKIPPAPPEPALWPIMLSIVLLVLVAMTLIYHRSKKRTSWKTQALHELEQLEQLPSTEIPLRSAKLLKRIALTHQPTDEVRKLRGEPWLNYLDSFYATDFFTKGSGRIVAQLYASTNHQQLIGSDQHKLSYVAELRRLVARCRNTPGSIDQHQAG